MTVVQAYKLDKTGAKKNKYSSTVKDKTTVGLKQKKPKAKLSDKCLLKLLS